MQVLMINQSSVKILYFFYPMNQTNNNLGKIKMCKILRKTFSY